MWNSTAHLPNAIFCGATSQIFLAVVEVLILDAEDGGDLKFFFYDEKHQNSVENFSQFETQRRVISEIYIKQKKFIADGT
jgi:hypothetical protein